jgi:hypothetical protein
MSSDIIDRAVRRETHSPRSAATIIVASIVAVVLAYLAVEVALDLFGQRPLLIQPSALLAAFAEPAAVPTGILAAGGIVVFLIGILLFVLAVAPGRLSKHSMRTRSGAAAVDNGVIASSLAQRVSDEVGIERRRVEVGVGHRIVDVTVRPVLGLRVDPAEVKTVVDDELSSYDLDRSLATRVRIEHSRERGLEP